MTTLKERIKILRDIANGDKKDEPHKNNNNDIETIILHSAKQSGYMACAKDSIKLIDDILAEKKQKRKADIVRINSDLGYEEKIISLDISFTLSELKQAYSTRDYLLVVFEERLKEMLRFLGEDDSSVIKNALKDLKDK